MLSCVRTTSGRAAGRAPRARASAAHPAAPGWWSRTAPRGNRTIDKFVSSNKIVVFMKGNKEQPRCGFSNTVVQVFKSMEVPFETVDILEDEGLRAGDEGVLGLAHFPPGVPRRRVRRRCDIIVDTYKDGTLKEAVDVAMMS